MDTLVITDQQKRIDYINSLDLAELPFDTSKFSKTVVQESDENSAYVTAGGIVSFVAGLAMLQKQDVLNSTLLAQLAANKAFNRETQTVAWFNKYREVLENVGWVVGSFDFTRYQSSGSTFTVETVVMQLIAAIATQNALLVTQASIAAIKAMSAGSKQFAIWDSTTHNSSNGNFQIAPCVNSDGNVAMALGAFYFSSETVDSQFLWFSYSSSRIDLYKGGQLVVLNEQIYALVRQQVINKLGNKATQYIADLEI